MYCITETIHGDGNVECLYNIYGELCMVNRVWCIRNAKIVASGIRCDIIIAYSSGISIQNIYHSIHPTAFSTYTFSMYTFSIYSIYSYTQHCELHEIECYLWWMRSRMNNMYCITYWCGVRNNRCTMYSNSIYVRKSRQYRITLPGFV